MKFAHSTFDSRSDTSIPLQLRRGDALVWLRNEAVFAAVGDYRPADVWFLSGGEVAQFAFESKRLPPWYELHPTEMAGILVHRYRHDPAAPPPAQPLEGPGLWKVRAGDKVLLILVPRPEMGTPQGMCCVIDFADNCLLWVLDADMHQPGLEFASVPIGPESEALLRTAIREGIARANAKPPRNIAMNWTLNS